VKSKANLMFKKSLFLAFFLIISIAYSDEPFEKGKVIERVYCLNDSTHSYALYLPSTYSSDQQWPIIYLFEPAARAILPVQKYAELAERFGYILVCTYNARNGPREPNLKAADIFINDMFNRLSMDKKRMYTSGFSGGSRLATMIALIAEDISGVIACGAGFPYDQIPSTDINFSYFGIVGRLDMNYQEMLELESNLSQLEIQNQFEYFKGDHDWPPAEIFKKAFYWLETNAMRNNLIPKDNELIAEINTIYTSEMDSISDANPIYCKYMINKKYINYLSDLEDITAYVNEARRIYQLEEYKSEFLGIEHITQTEREYQQKFNEEFRQISLTAFKEDYPVRPLSWWKNEIKELKSSNEDQALTLEEEMHQRLLNFLLLVSWEEYQNYYTQNRYATAIKFMEIGELAGSDQAWVNYLLAKAYAKAGNDKQVLKQLNEAVIKGYNKVNILEHDEAFAKIRDNKKYKEIVTQMKMNDISN